MPKTPPLEFFDLETIRLGHYMALRRINNSDGELDHYYVIGQPTPWKRRIQSIAKLVRYRFLETDEQCPECVECVLYLTKQGEKVYEEFTRREESGELRKNMLELQAKRRKALEEAYNEYMELKRLSDQEKLDKQTDSLINKDEGQDD